MDPLDHPDLQYLGRKLRERLDETLDAEQDAARSAEQRRLTLRERLLEAEDRGERAVVSTVDGQLHSGMIDGVGADHIVVGDASVRTFIAIPHIVSVQVR